MFKKKAKPIRKSARGSVSLIAMLLVTSAMLRLASGAGVAIAQASENEDVEVHSSTQTVSSNGLQNSRDKSASRLSMNKLLVALQEREAKVKEREKLIEVRSKALEVAGEEITKRLVLLEEAETQLRSTLSLADGAAERDLARLTSVYENMKPKDAAALFEMMEPDFAAGFLGRMRPDAAAAVMAGLTPDAAYSISVILASRNASVPKT